MTEGSLEVAIREELQKIIDARGLTQVEAAKVFGVSAKHLNQVLRGASHASVETLQKASERLGIRWRVEIVDLMQEEEEAGR